MSTRRNSSPVRPSISVRFSALARAALGVAVAAAIFTAPAQADTGMRALQRGDYQTALQLWTPIAEQGSARAQYNISVLYEKGLGVRRDDALAVAWLQRAARSGSTDARERLNAREVQESLREAKLRARKGDSSAMIEIATLYADGTLVTRDFAKAHLWYSRAMKAGHPLAAGGRMRLEYSMTRSEIEKARAAAKSASLLRPGAIEQMAYSAHGIPD